MSAEGQISAQPRPLNGIPVPLAELFAVAVEHEGNDRLDDAERLLGHILAAEPEQADALHLHGIVCCRRRQFEQAAGLMERSIQHGVNTPLYWRNIGEVYRQVGRLEEALDAGRRAVRLHPDDATALSNLAVIHASRMELDAAEARGREALRLDPDHAGAHFGLAEVLLTRGEMAEGWAHYEWRFRLPQGAVNLPPAATRPPQWDGRPMAPGTLMVIADQGFGDVIQFGRYIPWVLERCAEPAFAASDLMRDVLEQLGARRIHSTWPELPACEAYIPLTGLPRLAGTRVDSIPVTIPYLHADPVLAAAWKARLDRLMPRDYRRIGLVWAGRAEHPNDRQRSTTLTSLAPLFDLEQIAFVSLQKGVRQADCAGLFGKAPLLNLGPSLSGWADTMAVISGLHSVVTVDTAVAHLAGAMGKPVYLMLPAAAEWRWLEGREDSPWYPATRLLRAIQPCQPLDVSDHLVAALRSLDASFDPLSSR